MKYKQSIHIIGMKIYLTQIFFRVLFGFEKIQLKYRYHRDENISGANLLVVPLGFDKI